ncbi:MAG: hypothetical protein AAGE94_17860 [Acidobacteriota bacterium]
MLKLVQDDYAVLRRFHARGAKPTYLHVLVRRVLIDRRAREWGRWRPTAQAQRAGTTAILLDRLINRDGLEPSEAARALADTGRGTADTLEALATTLPRRPPRRHVDGDTHLRHVASRRHTDRRLDVVDLHPAAGRITNALRAALAELSAEDRQYLTLRFVHGWAIRRIADHHDLERRPFYRRFARLLNALRAALRHHGIAWQDIATVLDAPEIELDDLVEPERTHQWVGR